MQLSWKLRGAYANWHLTMTVEPPDIEEGDEPVRYVDDWPTESMARVYTHFTDVVNLLECGRQLEETRQRGVRV